MNLVIELEMCYNLGWRFSRCCPELLSIRVAPGNDTDGGFSGDPVVGPGRVHPELSKCCVNLLVSTYLGNRTT